MELLRALLLALNSHNFGKCKFEAVDPVNYFFNLVLGNFYK